MINALIKKLGFYTLLSLCACGGNGTAVPKEDLDTSLIGTWKLSSEIVASESDVINSENKLDFILKIKSEDNCTLSIEDDVEVTSKSCQTGNNVIVLEFDFEDPSVDSCLASGTIILHVEFKNKKPKGSLKFVAKAKDCNIEANITNGSATTAESESSSAEAIEASISVPYNGSKAKNENSNNANQASAANVSY